MSDSILNSETTASAEPVQQTEAPTVENTTVESSAPETTATAETNQVKPAEVSFIETISEDLRAQGNLKDFNSVDDLAKSYVNLQRMVGNSVRIPPEDASPEAKKEFLDKIKDIDGILLKDDENLFNKLGRPETADQYKFEEIIAKDLADTVPSLYEEVDDFKQIAHEIGLTNEQAAKLVEMRMNTLKGSQENMQLAREDAEAKLKEMWGQDFNNRLDAAKQVAKIYSEKYGDEMQALINSPAGNNPVILNMMAELASMYKEQGHIGVQTAQFGMTPEMARQKIADKRADSGFMQAYTDDMHPGHKQAVAELQKLYSIVHNQ